MADGERGSDPGATGSEPRGINSIEVGARLLEVLSSASAPLMLKQLANEAGMPPAKAHRYLVTFLKTGLAARDDASGRYTLGPFATRLGVRALARHDALAKASSALTDFRDTIGESCFLSCWTDRGPIIYRWEESLRPVTVMVRVGSLMPLLRSATGRAFLTYMRPNLVLPVLAEETGDTDPNRSDVKRIMATTRARGVSEVHGEFQSDIDALSAPIFDPIGNMVASITALGRKGQFDASMGGFIERRLKEFARHCAS